MLKSYLAAGGLLLCVGMTCSAANATVVSGGITAATNSAGEFVILDPTSSFVVGNDNFQNPNLYAFDEGQNITITTDLSVDVGSSITAGTVVASHYVFFDPMYSQSQTGFITFDSAVLGIATSEGTMSASDFLINNSVTYLSPAARGIEGGDDVWIASDDPNTIWVSWSASSPGDYIRIFTEYSPSAELPAVPLPAALPLLIAAIGSLGITARRRR